MSEENASRPRLTVRLLQTTQARLEASAKENRRTLNAEVEFRLDKALPALPADNDAASRDKDCRPAPAL